MTTGTGTAIAGVWIFAGLAFQSPLVSELGAWGLLVGAVVATVWLSLTDG